MQVTVVSGGSLAFRGPCLFTAARVATVYSTAYGILILLVMPPHIVLLCDWTCGVSYYLNS